MSGAYRPGRVSQCGAIGMGGGLVRIGMFRINTCAILRIYVDMFASKYFALLVFACSPRSETPQQSGYKYMYN